MSEQKFQPGDPVTVRGQVLRIRRGRYEIQTADGELVRATEASMKAVSAPPATAAVRGPDRTK